jgi:hypothetical protein
MYEIMQTLIHELTHISHEFHFTDFLSLNDALVGEVREQFESGAIGAVPSWDIPVDAGSENDWMWWFRKNIRPWLGYLRRRVAKKAALLLWEWHLRTMDSLPDCAWKGTKKRVSWPRVRRDYVR